MNDSRQAILRLMNEYCNAADAGDFEAFAKLFEHGVFHVIGDPTGPLDGREAVMGLLQNVTLYNGKPLTKHVLSNVQIDVDEPNGVASAQSYITVFQAVPPDFPLQPIFIGHYHDKFERTGSQWRFKNRSISPDMIGDISHHRSDMA